MCNAGEEAKLEHLQPVMATYTTRVETPRGDACPQPTARSAGMQRAVQWPEQERSCLRREPIPQSGLLAFLCACLRWNCCVTLSSESHSYCLGESSSTLLQKVLPAGLTGCLRPDGGREILRPSPERPAPYHLLLVTLP